MSQIKDLAVGDGYIYLMENGVKTKFYVLKHDYESGLNGAGRTLVVRESPVKSGVWSSGDTNTNGCCGWEERKPIKSGLITYLLCCEISDYLNSTYLSSLSADAQKWLSETRYYAYTNTAKADSTGTNTAMSSAVFTVSAAESVVRLSGSTVSDGSLLAYDARKRLEQIFTAYGSGIWTRTLGRNYSYRSSRDSDGDRDYFFYHGILLSGVSDSEWGVFSYADSSTLVGTSHGYLPCFTLPETLYVTSDGFATENQPPEVTSTAGKSGTDLGEKNAPFALSYTVTDGDGDTMTVTEKLDGQTSKLRTGVASGTALTFEQTNTAAGFQKILNGSHTLAVNVSDGKSSSDFNATFTKAVHAASVTLAEPLAVDGDITVAVLQVTGSIPDDAVFKAEVTNNAKDAAPVWQDATTEVQKGTNIVFANSTATNGAAFNFRVSVERGESGEGGYIEAVTGAFE